MTLLFSITACSSGKGGTAAGGNEDQQPDNPVPIVDVSLGLEPQAIVAEYEGGSLTAEQFESYLRVQVFINPQYGLAIQQNDPQALTYLIERYVAEETLANRADQSESVDEQVQHQINQLKSEYLTVYNGDEKRLKKQMKDQDVTDQQLEQFYRQYFLASNHLGSKVTDEDMQRKYEATKQEDKDSFVVASVRHILIAVGEPPTGLADGEKPRSDEEARKLAEEITERLRNGEDFAELAKEYTDDPGSKETGGLYEDVYVTEWVPEFKKAAAELPLDTISDPIKAEYGYHILRVEKRTEHTVDQLQGIARARFVGEIIDQKYLEFVNQDLKEILKEENIHLPKQDEK
ncbi:peptidylprolyl isomerase [Ammoniphilus oxalaticus]|uniref:peptidylprolyl isomerase n=1 Tax=Ammoniphilus oxalaticus TaxID=66863 RepID=UPI00147641C7|nr:peptidylprolyl isomerase [Ammoniphilus oxalaticus]